MLHAVLSGALSGSCLGVALSVFEQQKQPKSSITKQYIAAAIHTDGNMRFA